MATTIDPRNLDRLTPKGRQVLAIRNKLLALLRQNGRLRMDARLQAPYVEWRSAQFSLIMSAMGWGGIVDPRDVPEELKDRIRLQAELWSRVRTDSDRPGRVQKAGQGLRPRGSANATGKVMNISWRDLAGPIDVSTFRRGPWEEVLLAIDTPDSASGATLPQIASK